MQEFFLGNFVLVVLSLLLICCFFMILKQNNRQYKQMRGLLEAERTDKKELLDTSLAYMTGQKAQTRIVYKDRPVPLDDFGTREDDDEWAIEQSRGG